MSLLAKYAFRRLLKAEWPFAETGFPVSILDMARMARWQRRWDHSDEGRARVLQRYSCLEYYALRSCLARSSRTRPQRSLGGKAQGVLMNGVYSMDQRLGALACIAGLRQDLFAYRKACDGVRHRIKAKQLRSQRNSLGCVVALVIFAPYHCCVCTALPAPEPSVASWSSQPDLAVFTSRSYPQYHRPSLLFLPDPARASIPRTSTVPTEQ